MGLDDYLRAMPKVELHLHLEGSIRPAILLELAEQHGVELPVRRLEDVQRWYIFRDFNHFVQIYVNIVKVLQTPDDFKRITYDLGRTLAAQNVQYAEVTWTPSLHVNKPGMSFERLLDSINAGRDQAKAEFGIDMRWIPDIARNLDVELAVQLAEWISSPYAQANGVVALGLGGQEVGYPPELFEEAFRVARQNGLPGNPHAGELMGPSSMWGAIHNLHAIRIGHGVRATEDPALVDYLVEHQIPLEINPTSNLCLNVFPSYEQHSLKTLFDAGVLVTINSDDPPMFNTTINEEYLHAVYRCGLTVSELETIALNAVKVSYLPDDQKAKMLAQFEAEYAHLRRLHGLDGA